MPLSLDKVAEKAPSLLSLAKNASAAVDMSGLNGQTAKVALVLDFSASMHSQYRSGAMQRLAEKVLALATQFDDDGAIDFFVFDSGAAHLGEISLDDFSDGVSRLIGKRRMGTTNYAAAFLAVRDHFGFPAALKTSTRKGLFGGPKKVEPAAGTVPADQPVYALFLTDGAPDSKPAAVKALTEVSTTPIFWKFLSIGREEMAFLQKLDDLDERFIDNADYKAVGDTDQLSDTALFEAMLDEYPAWIAEARTKGLIR
ncbi:VWA domain-containing protein [Arthrobacter zhaoxinii]|uniref:VWA domain-containing protein n=1 Tax=Arthrobacter zhaoxinii TaxID=2964616 RepID=A0ABY5YV13_9MICC|nr:VWA domain-containing protein [Arthrobacter zhaoxinii]UWX97834.1 VWA domain-containing protein [Arthrobacter zhaoxinii]